MRRIWVIPLVLGISGCMVSNGLQYETMSETNLYHIARVRKGMSEKEVLQIMHKPYSYESFQVDDDIYDVWFYVTTPTGLDQTRMVAQNLTPLTFKNGVLVGTGYYWYYYAMKSEAEEVSAQGPQGENPKTQEGDDKAFERALKPNSQKPPSSTEQPPSDQKLPPNVHIIGKNEISCCPHPEKMYGSSRFSVLAKGMSEMQVTDIVGKPMKYEKLTIEDDVYEIWFYETIASKSNKVSIVPQHLTPLIFQNALLVSTQEDAWYDLKERAKCLAIQETPLEEQSHQVSVKSSAQKTSIFKPYIAKTPLSVPEKKFAKLRKGMSEGEVMGLLGPTADQESLSIDDDVYDIWFYEVLPKNQKNPSKKIPLTFKNGHLLGTTLDAYNKIRKEAGLDQIDGYDQRGERMEEDESEQNFNYW